VKRNSWMTAIRILWRRGHYWEAIATWIFMQWIWVEAYLLPTRSMRRAMREIQKAKR